MNTIQDSDSDRGEEEGEREAERGRSHRTGNRDAMRRKGKEGRAESSAVDPEGRGKNGREEKDFRNLQK